MPVCTWLPCPSGVRMGQCEWLLLLMRVWEYEFENPWRYDVPTCVRVGRRLTTGPKYAEPRHTASGYVMLWPCILGCVCVGAVCTRVHRAGTPSTALGSVQELGPPCWAPGRSSSPLWAFLAGRPARVSIPSFQVSSQAGEDQTSRCPK